MTATNHALIGAAIALSVKRPELAIPLAFVSHFAADLIPHYNPPGSNRSTFKNHAESWSRKMRKTSFRFIFTIDMTLLVLLLIVLPFMAPSSVSPLTLFLSMIAAISPDFLGGIQYLSKIFFGMKFKNGRFTNFHISLQWMERPWGIYVELVWFVLIGLLIHRLLS